MHDFLSYSGIYDLWILKYKDECSLSGGGYEEFPHKQHAVGRNRAKVTNWSSNYTDVTKYRLFLEMLIYYVYS